jgi:hypothetical protein
LGTFRVGFESGGRPRRLACDRSFRLGARIRTPLKFRIVNRIVERATDREPGPAARYDIQPTPTGQTFDPDDALALDVVGLSVLDVVVVISVAAMIVPMIGHGVSDCRASDAAHDRANRTADNSAGNRAPDRASDQTVLVGKGNLR